MTLVVLKDEFSSHTAHLSFLNCSKGIYSSIRLYCYYSIKLVFLGPAFGFKPLFMGTWSGLFN